MIQLFAFSLHYWTHVYYFRVYYEGVKITKHLGILFHSHHIRAYRHFHLVLDSLLHHVLLVFVNDTRTMLLPDLR